MKNELHLRNSWPVTSITGEPSIQELSMTVSREDGGGVLFTGMIGHRGSDPTDCEHFQFVLTPAHVPELAAFLS
ncbi:hypothetical protein AB0L62_12780 [Nocardia asteroides]|uniref:hypothetical protein n=1 Tax=Nocardia asteroides TaxID=1824 RepID=UPI00341CCC2B